MEKFGKDTSKHTAKIEIEISKSKCSSIMKEQMEEDINKEEVPSDLKNNINNFIDKISHN